MLEKEFQYYLDNQNELVKKYAGKYLVIKNQIIIGAYESNQEAFIEATKSYEIGTFLIQLCEKGEESYSQHFHSRVVFN